MLVKKSVYLLFIKTPLVSLFVLKRFRWAFFYFVLDLILKLRELVPLNILGTCFKATSKKVSMYG